MAKKKENKDLVPYSIFFDSDKYSDDVTLGLNGDFSKIQRGEEIMITRDQREVLEHSKYQKQSTTRMLKGMQNDFLKKNI